MIIEVKLYFYNSILEKKHSYPPNGHVLKFLI